MRFCVEFLTTITLLAFMGCGEYANNGRHVIIIIIIIIIFINCNWVVTRWQYTLTHKNNIEQHN